MSTEYIEKLLEKIFEITARVSDCLKKEQFEEMNQLLSDRDHLMEKVNQQIALIQGYRHSHRARGILEKIIQVDQQMTTVLTKETKKAQEALEQVNISKKISKKFEPFNTQLNGVFLDARK